jgi:hypothetical protein
MGYIYFLMQACRLIVNYIKLYLVRGFIFYKRACYKNLFLVVKYFIILVVCKGLRSVEQSRGIQEVVFDRELSSRLRSYLYRTLVA